MGPHEAPRGCFYAASPVRLAVAHYSPHTLNEVETTHGSHRSKVGSIRWPPKEGTLGMRKPRVSAKEKMQLIASNTIWWAT